MHRKHHQFSDTEHDPHSPHFFEDVLGMMLETGRIYGNLVRYPAYLKKTFPDLYNNLPTWELLDRIGDNRWVRIMFGVIYTFVYIHVILQLGAAPWYMFFLLPVHYLMGPIQGATVNWVGHKYGYRNYNLNDKSHNAEPLGVFLLGELHQNNHHQYPHSLSFAKKWFEFDLAYPFIKLLSFLRVIKIV
jgi:stearoyl-CoA desaturase (delta-9 desaturase)